MEAYSQDAWTEAQWTQVREAVRDEARKQRVAASFLPLHGPVPTEDQTVMLQTLALSPPPPPFVQEIDDFNMRRLTSLSVHVALRSAQVAEPDLSSALVAFRRAANLIARTEDYLVFRGQWGVAAPPFVPGLAPCYITGGAQFDGLLDTALNWPQQVFCPAPFNPTGPQVVTLVSRAIGILEAQGHTGPFALVLGNLLFNAAHNPNLALVLPADRIKPMIDGPLIRSSTLNRYVGLNERASGLLVSLAGNLADLVVASEIDVRFLQVTAAPSPRHVYRVSERFTLRIKQETAIVALS